MAIKKVAVIGAGVSGVSAAIHLQNAGLDVAVFERGTKAGGVWVYDKRSALEPAYPSELPSTGDSPEFESILEGQAEDRISERRDSPVQLDNEEQLLALQHAPPGPCYFGLMNNVSTPEMQLESHKWKPGTADFVKHDVLAEYIQDAALANGVQDVIEYQTRVNRVEKSGDRWNFHISKLVSEGSIGGVVSSIRTFDAVVVASGHYHAPNVPDYPGLSAWKHRHPARIQHSKGYREPSAFTRKNVLLIGAGVSSTDIARELGPVANHIYQSSRGGEYDLTPSLLPENAERVGAIEAFLDDEREVCPNDSLPGSVRLVSGEEIHNLHHVIVATGYHMSYPFLRNLHADNIAPEDASPTTLVTIGQTTHNLHKDIFYIPDPTLSFIGVPYHVATFSLFEFQAMALAAVYAGTAILPSEADMRHEYEERIIKKGIGRKFHSLKDDNGEIEYVKDMMRIANQGRREEDKLEGHSKEWLEAYQRRLARLEKLRGKKKEGVELAWAKQTEHERLVV